jgi:hypothetical protein
VLPATRTRRRGLGRVWLFDLFGEQSSAWTPIQGCENWNRALMTAEWLGDAANEGHTSEAGHFWRGEAATLLAPLLYAAGLVGADMPQVLHWLHDRSVKEVLDILDTDHTQGAAAAAQFDRWRVFGLVDVLDGAVEMLARPAYKAVERFAMLALGPLLQLRVDNPSSSSSRRGRLVA